MHIIVSQSGTFVHCLALKEQCREIFWLDSFSASGLIFSQKTWMAKAISNLFLNIRGVTFRIRKRLLRGSMSSAKRSQNSKPFQSIYSILDQENCLVRKSRDENSRGALFLTVPISYVLDWIDPVWIIHVSYFGILRSLTPDLSSQTPIDPAEVFSLINDGTRPTRCHLESTLFVAKLLPPYPYCIVRGGGVAHSQLIMSHFRLLTPLHALLSPFFNGPWSFSLWFESCSLEIINYF